MKLTKDQAIQIIYKINKDNQYPWKHELNYLREYINAAESEITDLRSRIEAGVAAYERGKQDAADLLYCEWTEGGGTSKNGTCPKGWWHSANCKKCKILTLQDRGAEGGQ